MQIQETYTTRSRYVPTPSVTHPGLPQSTYSCEQLANRWGVSEATISAMLCHQDIKSFRFGSKGRRVFAHVVADFECAAMVSLASVEGEEPCFLLHRLGDAVRAHRIALRQVGERACS